MRSHHRPWRWSTRNGVGRNILSAPETVKDAPSGRIGTVRSVAPLRGLRGNEIFAHRTLDHIVSTCPCPAVRGRRFPFAQASPPLGFAAHLHPANPFEAVPDERDDRSREKQLSETEAEHRVFVRGRGSPGQDDHAVYTNGPTARSGPTTAVPRRRRAGQPPSRRDRRGHVPSRPPAWPGRGAGAATAANRPPAAA